MDEPEYECSGGCGLLPRSAFHEFKSRPGRPVTSRCRACRREDGYKERYPDQICGCCMKHRPLDGDGVCMACHEELGLRECKGRCNRLLPNLLLFYGKRRVCKDCLKGVKPAD